MPESNQSFVTFFEIIGFPGLDPKYCSLVSAVLFIVYVCIVTGNMIIIALFATDKSLHKPPYYAFLNLVVSDVLFSTTTLPKIIYKYWFQSGTISFDGCFIQMYFVHYFGSVNSYALLIMALDRYLAICHPLRYPILFNNSTVYILSVTAWIIAKVIPLMMVIRAYPLPYCALNTIIHCYCDHISITKLACTNRAPYGFPAFIGAMIVLLGPLSFIIFSYVSIVQSVLKIANAQGRLKTLGTCSTQLIIIALYYLPRCFIYMASNVGIIFSTDMRIFIIMMYSHIPPMVNPVIYCLRAKDMRQSFVKHIKRTTAPEK